jgi:PTH1 family peptidyl-tRNA hydrolase
MANAPKLIVGIGNPDAEYQNTRHNVGWMFLDWLQATYDGSEFTVDAKLKSQLAQATINSHSVWLQKPLTYVNLSGSAVASMKRKAKVTSSDIIVVQDDLDIPFGMCKLSFDKNSGGHNGIESIIASLRTKKFHRIRIGIGVRALDAARTTGGKTRDEFVRTFVLKPFSPSERNELDTVFEACHTRLLQILKN